MIRIAAVALLLLAPAQLWAGAMEIKSDKMVFLHQNERAEFTSNVLLTRDDFELRCDRLFAYYKGSNLDRAEAFGHIRIVQRDITGRSNKAILDQKNNILTLIGNAVLEQKGNRITGERIVHDMGRERTIVQPAKGGRTHMRIESDDRGATSLPGKEK